jgi:uncharacterized heparinase superfamily protein
MRLLLYLNTIKFLKPIQIFYRIKFLLFPSNFSSSKTITFSKPTFLSKYKYIPKPDSFNFQKSEFIFLNKKSSFNMSSWDFKSASKLWQYNLYYFDFINSTSALDYKKEVLDMILNWIVYDRKITSLEPYPVSLRLVNWIKWIHINKIDNEVINHDLFLQTQYLYNNLEYHLLGNHLFANAKALVFSGVYFNCKESDRWLTKGIKIIESELNEQILKDGGAFERSPMYHSILLEDLLDLHYLLSSQKKDFFEDLLSRLKEKINSMFYWLEVMSHPDGQISFFNDCAFGISRSLEELVAFSEDIKVYKHKNVIKKCDNLSCYKLSDSGYIRVNGSNFSAFLDVAEIGPKYIPGHAHADTLSFELSIFNERFIVNGGTSTYDNNMDRHKERSTSSHNTLELNKHNSSEVWSSFRVAKRASPNNLKMQYLEDEIYITCQHDGYKRLPGKPIHRRSWHFSKNNIRIQDSVKYFASNKGYTSKIRYRIHPDVRLETINANLYELTLRDKKIYFKVKDNLSFIEDSFFAPEFNKKLNSKTICIETKGCFSEVEIYF